MWSRSRRAPAVAFVQPRDGVLGDELAIAAGAPKADGQVGRGIVWGEWLESETTRVQRAATAEAQAPFEIAEAHEDDDAPGLHRVVLRPPPFEPGVHLSLCTGLSIDYAN
jgi:hypothetical protein